MEKYTPIIQTYGQGKPIVVIIGCVHGNELLGKRVITALHKLKIIKGTLITVIANPLALKNKKRFIDVDLNRCFPGKRKGGIEEKIAYYLTKKIRKVNYVIDIHSTTANTEDLAIIKHKNTGVGKIIKIIHPKNVILISRKSGNHSLIKHCLSGVCLEYGERRPRQTYIKSLQDIKRFLLKLGMIRGKMQTQKKKMNAISYYKLYNEEKKPKGFVMRKNLKNLKLIKKGGLLGRVKGETILAQEDFYPVLFGEKHYKDIIGFRAKKIGDIFSI